MAYTADSFEVFETHKRAERDAQIGGSFPQDEFMAITTASIDNEFLAVLPFTIDNPEPGFSLLPKGITVDFAVEGFRREASQNIVPRHRYNDPLRQNTSDDRSWGMGKLLLPPGFTEVPDKLPEDGTNRFISTLHGSYVVYFAFDKRADGIVPTLITFPIFQPKPRLEAIR